jgi:hypothetical protein
MAMNLERTYLLSGLGYGALGMSLGIHMAASHDHGQAITHAHLLLVGFLLSVIYALIHRLWLSAPPKVLARIQFAAHHLGVIMMVTGLFLLYGGHVPGDRIEPLLASSSIIVLIALILMIVLLLVPARERLAPTEGGR